MTGSCLKTVSAADTKKACYLLSSKLSSAGNGLFGSPLASKMRTGIGSSCYLLTALAKEIKCTYNKWQ